jgi:hypothetical protein
MDKVSKYNNKIYLSLNYKVGTCMPCTIVCVCVQVHFVYYYCSL